MNDDLAQEAISLALSGDWKKASEINQEILKSDPENIDALNRLSRAEAEQGNLLKARRFSQRVLKIDPFNSIAQKSLEKRKNLKKGEIYLSIPSNAQVFLEEPGKTKIVALLHLGSSKILAKLDAGDEVKLNTHAHRISVVTKDSRYVGRIPDDLSARLRNLIKKGNEYKVFIKSINKKEVKVFIRETKRSKKFSNIPSFSTEKIEYLSFTPPEFVYKKEKVHLNEENED